MKKRSLAPVAATPVACRELQPVLALVLRNDVLRNDVCRSDVLRNHWRGRLGMILTAIALLVALSACNSEPSQPAESKPEPKGADLLTGRSAFQKDFVAARGWAPDAKPYRIDSAVTADGGNGQNGKWALWRGSFASAEKHATKSYTWSGSGADGAPSRGVNPNPEDSYNPSNSTTQAFDINFLKIDSDQAFASAQKHGGDKVLEKDPTTPVIYVCDWNHNTNELVWHVIYGASRESAKLTVAVNASTGDFIRVEK